MKRVFGNTPIYWINLNSSIDRKISMETQLQDTNHTRIGAIDGTNKINFDLTYNIIGIDKSWSTALTACLCSHIKVLKIADENQLPHVIVLEDKCHFEYIEYFEKSIDEICEILNKQDPNWEIVQLSTVPLYYNLNDYKKHGFQIRKRSAKFCGTNYLINKNGIKKICDAVYMNDTTYDFSKFLKLPCVDPESAIFSGLNAYVLNFPLFYVYSPKSTFEYYYNKNMKPKNNMPIILKTKNQLENFINEIKSR